MKKIPLTFGQFANINFKLRFIFLLLISSPSFGQATFHSLISDSPNKLPFVLGELISIPASEARGEGTFNAIVTPFAIYDSGKTHISWQTTTVGSLNILTYDDRYGLSRPIRFYPPRGGYDGHHRPAILTDADTLYVGAEFDHNDEPIQILRARSPNDELVWELSGTTIGTIPTYPHFSKKQGVFVEINQFNDINVGYNKNSDGFFEGDWTNETQITTRIIPDEDEHYPVCILNENIITDRVPFIVGGRNDDTATPTWYRKYLIRADIQAGSNTYYDWDESFSKTSQLTASELSTNFLYYTTGADNLQGYIPTPALDDQGNFYDISGDGSGGYDFIYMMDGATSATVKAISLPGNPPLVTVFDVTADAERGQNGACILLFATSPTDVYAIFRQDSTGFAKPFLYITHDLGDTWESEGDLLPTIDDDILSFVIPHNYKEIGNNKNFMVAFSSFEDPTFANLYVYKAAFGSVQPDDGIPFNDVTAYSESEYNNLMVRSYFVEAGKITNTGTTCNSLIDQSPSGQNANTTGSPVLDNATAPTNLLFDASNDAASVPTSGITTLSEGMIIAVVDMIDGTAGNFITASRNSVTTDFLAYGKSAADRTRFIDSNAVVMEGQEDVSDAYHIFVFLHQNGTNTDVLHFFDGALQQRVVTTGNSQEGGFFNQLGGLTNIEIGRLVRTTTNFYGFRLKHVAISDEPFSYEMLRKATKFLATKYGITLNSGYR